MQFTGKTFNFNFRSIRFLLGAGVGAAALTACLFLLMRAGMGRPAAPGSNARTVGEVSPVPSGPRQPILKPVASGAQDAKAAVPAHKTRKAAPVKSNVAQTKAPVGTATQSTAKVAPKLDIQVRPTNSQAAEPDGNKNSYVMQADGGNASGENGDDPKSHSTYFYYQRAYPNAQTPPGARQNSLAQLDSMIAQQRALGLLPPADAPVPPPLGWPEPAAWTNIGPQPVTNSAGGANFGNPASTGRVTAIAVDPNLPSTVFLGAATGGVWKSTDSGTTWNTTFDNNKSLAIGGIGIAPSSATAGNPSQTIYVGTGENNFSLDSYYGAGIYKSTDGGATWTQQCSGMAGGVAVNFCSPIGPIPFQGGGFIIGAIAVNPADATIADAAVVDFFNNANSGIYRTTNGGTLWTLIASASGAAGNGVVWNPTDPTVVYATLGGFSGTGAFGVYKSSDSGATFTKLTGNGVPNNNLPTSNLGRAELAVAPSNGSEVFVAINNINTSSLLGLAKSTDAGATWTFTAPSSLPSLPNFCNGQCWYDMALAVDPNNASIVVLGGSAFTNNSSTIFRSTDGGSTWVDITTGATAVRPHVDTHATTYANLGGGNSRLYTGDDGGIWFSDNPAAVAPITWKTGNNANLVITQFYPGHTTHPTDTNFDLGGTQDNGTEKFSGSLAWDHVACGDGGYTAIDPNIPSTLYAGCQNLSLLRSPLNGVAGSWSSIINEIGTSGDRSLFIPPLAHDNIQSGVLYYGTFRVWQTVNFGNNWTAISPDLTGGSLNDDVTSIYASDTDSNTVYATTSNGRIWRTTNALAGAGAVWTNLTSAPLPPRYISQVKTDQKNANIAYLAFSGFSGFSDVVGHIFQTTNGGTTWVDISGTGAGALPNTPANAIAPNNTGAPLNLNDVFLATDIGVFECTTPAASPACQTWTPLTGLPTVPVTDLALRQNSEELRAVTHGRGVWDMLVPGINPSGFLLVTSISPSSAAVGSGTVPLTFIGNDFGVPSGTPQILVDGADPGVTNIVVSSANLMTATLPASVTASPGLHQITVMQPGHANNPSNPTSPMPFGVTGPASTLNSIAPTQMLANSAPFPLTLNGLNFECQSVPARTIVQFGKAVLNPTTCSGSSLTVTVPTNLINTAGVVAVSTFNPGPGGGLSGAQIFTVTVANVGLAPSPVPFGSQAQGTTGAPVTITVSNTGNGAATLGAGTPVTFTGANASDFAIVGGTTTCVAGFVLVANTGSCVINVTFTPGATGARTAQINVTDNAPGSPQADTLNGTGTGTIGLAPAPVQFGNQAQGTTSAAMTLTLSNSAASSVTLAAGTPVTITGANAGDFAIVGGTTTCTAGFVLVANTGSCVINVTFTPTATGARTATINVADNAAGSPQSDTLNGTGIVANVTMAPSPVPFGNQQQGTTSAATTITVSNTGTAPATLGAGTPVTITGANAGDFAIVGGTTTCVAGFVLVANTGSCVINVTFTPSATGARTAQVNVADNAPGTPQTDTLNGTGILANVTMAPSPVPFGNQAQGTTSAAITVTVSNTGNAPTTLGAGTPVTITGANAGDFAIVGGTTTCVANFVLVANTGSCVINVTFTPSATGARTGTLNVADNAPGTPQTDTLNGTGTLANVTLAPSPVPFGNQQQGTTSAATTITVSNTGTAPATLGAGTPVTISGANAGDFAIVGGTTTCVANFVLVANTGTCVINVTFTPSATGARTAQINVADNAPGTPQTDTLNGTGTLANVTLAPSPVPFGSQQQGTTSSAVTITVSNTGTAPSTLAAGTPVTITGANAGDFAIVGGTTTCVANFILVANTGACVINVTFTPSATGARTAQVNVADNAPGSPQTDTLNGTGTLSAVGLAPSPVQFGNQRVGTTSGSLTVTVSNTGNVAATLTAGTPVTITGANAADFAIVGGTTTCVGSFVLVANTGSCVINLTVTPSALGARTAQVNVADTAPGSPQSDALNATGTAPAVTLSTNSIPFGNQGINTTSAVTNVQVSNTGTATLNVASFTLTGTDTTQFVLTAATSGTQCNLAAAFQVLAGANCSFGVKFAPTTVGAKAASVNVNDDATGSPQQVSLTGTGAVAAVVLNPAPFTFPNQRVGTTSAATMITVSNGGAAPSTLAAANPITFTGANAGDFAIGAGTTCVANFVLVANTGSCVVNVTFTPGATGARTATLNISDDAPGSPQTGVLNGTGTAPAVTLNPNNIPFGNQNINAASGVTNVQVSNTGTDTLNVASISLAGANSNQFTLTAATSGTQCNLVAAFQVTAGSNCSFGVKFAPATVGAKAATVNVTDDAAGSPQQVTLSGTGTAAVIALAPSPVPFGSQQQSTTGAAVTITVTNTGTAAATLTGTPITITGANAGDFAVVPGTTTCTANFVLVATTGACVINVTFTPAATGARTATLNLADDELGSPQTDVLNGTGTLPMVAFNPSPVAFGNQRVGTTGAAVTVTVTNNGNQATTLSGAPVTITGVNSADFALAPGTTCVAAFVLTAGGGSCVVKITFTPGAVLARTANLNIFDDTPGSPQSDILNGTGTIPNVTLSPSPVPFGGVNVGSSNQMVVMVTNSGTAPSTLAAANPVTLTGANASDYAISAGTTCVANFVLTAGGGSCGVTLTFTPGALLARTATLNVADDAPGSPQSDTLNGTGTQPGVNLSSANVAFGTVDVSVMTPAPAVTLTNSGTGPLTITSFTIAGANPGDFSQVNTCPTTPNTLAAGANCTITPSFKPTTTGARAATIVITDNAAGSPHTITLGGSGVDFTPSSPTPPVTVPAGMPATYTITITPATGGFPNAVTFSATGAPAATTVTFNPASVTPGNAPASTTMTITTTMRGVGGLPTAHGVVPPRISYPPNRFILLWTFAGALLLYGLTKMRKTNRRRQLAPALFIAMVVMAAIGIAGCNQTPTGTPIGTSTITVTATSGSLSHTTTVSLTVQ
ncbi:MAG TPA: choice-of-anchor D domain-containing protein [Candidatus Acidoferrales bacterium]|nr:choice-of-anchor D domain-containing protein [Candidatus Acidoferrales bacterium]